MEELVELVPRPTRLLVAHLGVGAYMYFSQSLKWKFFFKYLGSRFWSLSHRKRRVSVLGPRKERATRTLYILTKCFTDPMLTDMDRQDLVCV